MERVRKDVMYRYHACSSGTMFPWLLLLRESQITNSSLGMSGLQAALLAIWEKGSVCWNFNVSSSVRCGIDVDGLGSETIRVCRGLLRT